MSGNRKSVKKHRDKIWPAFYMLAFFILMGTVFSALHGTILYIPILGTIGISVSAGFLIYALAPRKRKIIGRRLSLILVGLGLFLGAGIFGRESFQLEGFFFFILSGVFAGPVVHYLVAKIVGPILIGRSWCGWGCWTWMVLDYLPYKKSPGWREGLTWIRYAHFGLSLGLVLFLWFVIGYRHGIEWATTDGLYWFVYGNVIYFVIGIILAFAFKDNRAFCKYICPITVFLKLSGSLSILRITGDKDSCTDCTACDKACPMSIPVSQYILDGRPVIDNECVLCHSCIRVCPEKIVDLAIRFDRGGKTLPKRIPPQRTGQ